MKILVISNGFPFKTSNEFIFVKQLIDHFFLIGLEPIVIAPQSLTNILIRKKSKRPFSFEVNNSDKKYKVYSPKYISFSNIKFLNNLSRYSFRFTAMQLIKSEKLEFDTVYAHFLYGPGTLAYKISNKYNRPFFIALGESTFNFKISAEIKNTLINSNGIIAVSNEIRNRLSKIDIKLDDKILIKPNGIDKTLFYPKKVENLREQLNISKKDFVVIFVGSFIHRKGVLRLDKALKLISNRHIKAIFVGEGPENPDYDNIIIKKSMDHTKINDYLNISDVFVLPTLNEGSCNSIIEAMASGMPIISSNLSFNDELLRDDFSISINPHSIIEIQNSILFLYRNREKIPKMKKEAFEYSKNFTIENRAQKIKQFIEKNH